MGRTKRRGPPPQTIHVNITIEDKQILESLKRHKDEPLYETFHRVLERFNMGESMSTRIDELIAENHWYDEDLSKVLEQLLTQKIQSTKQCIESLSEQGRTLASLISRKNHQ